MYRLLDVKYIFMSSFFFIEKNTQIAIFIGLYLFK